MRSEPHIIVTCDRCEDYTSEVGLTALAGHCYDERNVDGELRREGWRLSDGGDICPNCIEDEEQEENRP